MEKKAKIIVFFIVLTLFIIITLILTIYNIRKNDIGYQEAKQNEDETILYDETEITTPVTNETMFYTVSKCIEKYLTISSYNLNQTEEEKIYTSRSVDFQTEEEKRKALYNLLSKDYIEKNSITTNNIKEYTHYTSEDLYFTSKKMNYVQNGTIEIYSVYGKLRKEQDYANSNDAYFIVAIDKANLTFYIEPVILEGNTDINQLELKCDISAIESNSNNTFEYDRVSKGDIPTRYIAHYKSIALYNTEEAYEYLNEEYREKRFGSLENYMQYVNNNKDYISKIFIDKYQIIYKDNYTQYTCIDTNGNYYIFRETATMQYTLMLDTYTIDIPEFTEKYNLSDEVTKVGMNIEKINTALNAKDYKYIYSKLPDSFKNNYFNTLDAFAGYMENTFYDKNTITYSEFSNEGKNYMFKIEVKDLNNAYNSTITKTIIMQLKDGTDFVFSFNV